jgi:urease accessory protein UreF
MEVAQQFGFLNDNDHVEAYLLAATHSALQLATPYVVAGMNAVATATTPTSTATKIMDDTLVTAWKALDQQHHALLVSNSPACQASIDQGHGLLRVALAWSQKQSHRKSIMYEQLRLLQSALPHHHGHLAPIFGIVLSLLGITNPHVACHMLAYSMARDMVSAAVRLNAIGPLASVSILDRVQQSLYKNSNIPNNNSNHNGMESSSLEDAASSAPLLDVLHPCHDMLAVRLFRS